VINLIKENNIQLCLWIETCRHCKWL